jgi:MFS family permease
VTDEDLPMGAGGFAFASAVGGMAVDQQMLFIARAAQGAFAALPGPASLALLTARLPEAPGASPGTAQRPTGS